MARPSLVPRVWGRGASFTELQLDADESSSTNNALTYSNVTQTGRLGYHSVITISGTIITILTNLNAQKMC